MSTRAPARAAARIVAAKRPITVMVAALIGLGGLGGAVGMVLGGTGAAASVIHPDRGHHHDDPEPMVRTDH